MGNFKIYVRRLIKRFVLMVEWLEKKLYNDSTCTFLPSMFLYSVQTPSVYLWTPFQFHLILWAELCKYLFRLYWDRALVLLWWSFHIKWLVVVVVVVVVEKENFLYSTRYFRRFAICFICRLRPYCGRILRTYFPLYFN